MNKVISKDAFTNLKSAFYNTKVIFILEIGHNYSIKISKVILIIESFDLQKRLRVYDFPIIVPSFTQTIKRRQFSAKICKFLPRWKS